MFLRVKWRPAHIQTYSSVVLFYHRPRTFCSATLRLSFSLKMLGYVLPLQAQTLPTVSPFQLMSCYFLHFSPVCNILYINTCKDHEISQGQKGLKQFNINWWLQVQYPHWNITTVQIYQCFIVDVSAAFCQFYTGAPSSQFVYLATAWRQHCIKMALLKNNMFLQTFT